jgi:hypothetical protein
MAQRAKDAYIATVYQPELSFNLSITTQVINIQEIDAKQLNKYI